MAHLIKRPDSELWWGSFTGADGRRIRRSTRTSDKAEATAILVAWEKTAREGRKKVLTEARVRRTMSDILEQFTGASLTCPSVAEYFDHWIESKKEQKAQKTVLKYLQTASHFLGALGDKTQAPLEAIRMGSFFPLPQKTGLQPRHSGALSFPPSRLGNTQHAILSRGDKADPMFKK